MNQFPNYIKTHTQREQYIATCKWLGFKQPPNKHVQEFLFQMISADLTKFGNTWKFDAKKSAQSITESIELPQKGLELCLKALYHGISIAHTAGMDKGISSFGVHDGQMLEGGHFCVARTQSLPAEAGRLKSRLEAA